MSNTTTAQAVTKREFGAFKRDRRALAQWSLEIGPEVVVMESTGVYWKSPFAALEAVGIVAWVVNARHVKASVPLRGCASLLCFVVVFAVVTTGLEYAACGA